MEIVLPEEGSHWYKPDGTPCHEVPRKSGGGMRSVSLRWDRHLGLFPSVTNVIGIKAQPQIVRYKVNQAIMSSVTLPRIKDEGVDDFVKRIVVDMDDHRYQAAEFGMRVHNATEAFHLSLKNGNTSPITLIEPYVSGYKEWLSSYFGEILHAERVLVNVKMGYAGTVDLVFLRRSDSRLVVLDTKTQGIKPGKKAHIHDTWILQLCAYGQLFANQNPVYISAVINSREPAPVTIYEWPEIEYKPAWRAFQACHYLWCHDRKYWPTAFWN